MKLPKDKKERIKVLVLIAVGVIGTLIGIIQIGVRPLLKKRKDCLQQIEEYTKKLETGRKEIKRALRDQKQNAEFRAKLRQLDEQYILHAEFENYYFNAKRQIEKMAANADVKLDSVRRGVQVHIPTVKGSAFERQFRAYTVKIVGEATYKCLIDMLAMIEKANPYVGISDLTIEAKQDEPEIHPVSFKVEWPIWVDSNIVTNFLELEEEETGPDEMAGVEN